MAAVGKLWGEAVLPPGTETPSTAPLAHLQLRRALGAVGPAETTWPPGYAQARDRSPGDKTGSPAHAFRLGQPRAPGVRLEALRPPRGPRAAPPTLVPMPDSGPDGRQDEESRCLQSAARTLHGTVEGPHCLKGPAPGAAS